MINNLYEEIVSVAMSMDKNCLPINGIQNADFENPVNLF